MIFYYYSKIDPKQEPVDKTKCKNYEEALEFFSRMKRLPKKIFLEIYEIINKNNDSSI